VNEKKLSDEEAKEMLKRLSEHFGEPVMPAGQYCAALNLWAAALRGKVERLEAAMREPGHSASDEHKHCKEFANMVGHVFMQIYKSNLLHRLIYQGESLRTEMCPIHKGVWSGCVPPDENPCACQKTQSGGTGSNVTGWLP